MIYLVSMAVILLILWGINRKYTPKQPGFYGYKTKRSMKNQATWLYANRVANEMLGVSILIFVLVGLVLLYMVEMPDEQALEIACLTFVGLSIAIVPITEYLLQVKFFKKKK